MGKKGGITLKGMVFTNVRDKSGSLHTYEIGDMFGIPIKGQGHVNKHVVFKDGKNMGLFTLTQIASWFRLDLTSPDINTIHRRK